MPYPTASDVENRLLEEGFTPPSGFDASSRIAAAINYWQKQTGWLPFLSDGNTYVLTYDPPGSASNTSMGFLIGGSSILKLKTPFLTVESVTVAGIAKTLNTDYWLIGWQPPYLGIRFAYDVWAPPQSIVVTGTTGYQADPIDEGAWEGILLTAVKLCVDNLILGVTKGEFEVTIGDVRKEYGSDPLRGFRNSLISDRDFAIDTYKNRCVGA